MLSSDGRICVIWHTIRNVIVFLILANSIQFNPKLNISLSFFCRFICEQPRMDNIPIRSGITIGHCWLTEFRQVGARTSLSDRIVYARGIARGWSLQKGDFYRQSKLFIINSRRRRSTRDAGMLITKTLEMKNWKKEKKNLKVMEQLNTWKRNRWIFILQYMVDFFVRPTSVAVVDECLNF